MSDQGQEPLEMEMVREASEKKLISILAITRP